MVHTLQNTLLDLFTFNLREYMFLSVVGLSLELEVSTVVLVLTG